MNLDLTGKHALVCGGSQGLGFASAIELALLGANITLVSRNKEKLQAALAQLDTSKNQQHQYLIADFENLKEVKNIIQAYHTNNRVVHILINNTGGPSGGEIINASLAQFEKHFKCMYCAASS